MELTQQQKNKLLALQEIVRVEGDTIKVNDLAVVQKVIEFGDKIDEQVEKVDEALSEIEEKSDEKMKEMDSHMTSMMEKCDEKLAEVEDGEDYVLTESDKKEIAGMIQVPVVEKIVEKVEVIREQPITIDNTVTEVKEVAVTDTGEEIIQKINDDETSLIKKEKVEGLDNEIKNINERISNIPRGGGGRSNNSTKFYPLTADGVTKIFTVPKSVASIVLMSDFPHILFENSGFTINATRTQITLTVDNAPSSGSQLIYQYSSMFN